MQQAIHPIKQPIQAAITLPGSEHIAYHALLLASLANGVSDISGVPPTDSIQTLLTALGQLGIVLQQHEHSQSCIVAGGNGQFPKKQSTVWCGDSESLAHFLLTACSATPGIYYFDGSAHLREAPLSPLLDILSRQGAQPIPPDASKLPLTLVGCEATTGGEINLDNSLSHETISALLMTAPYANSPITFTMLDAAHQSFIDTTCAMMAEFGVLTCQIHQGKFLIPVPQRYVARDYAIEPDFSLAAYFFAAAAITNSEITIKGAKYPTSRQADIKLLSILEKMGCRIAETAEGLTFKGTPALQGLDVNMRNFSHSFLALAAIAPFAKTPIRISHIGHLTHKDTERLNLLKSEWQKMRINVETGENWIKIYPGTPQGTIINAFRDRQLAMACAMMGLRAPGMIIENAEAITTLYPQFFSLRDSMLESSSA